MVEYLCRQQKFVSDEWSKCPLICDTRWINMIKVTTWFDKHRIAVVAYFDETNPDFIPDESWWILLLIVHEIAGISAILCKSLQGHSTLLCNQHYTLKRLVIDINSKVGIAGIMSELQRGVISKATHNFLTYLIMWSPSLLSEVLWRTWDSLSKITLSQRTTGIVTLCCNCQRPLSSYWWM